MNRRTEDPNSLSRWKGKIDTLSIHWLEHFSRSILQIEHLRCHLSSEKSSESRSHLSELFLESFISLTPAFFPIRIHTHIHAYVQGTRNRGRAIICMHLWFTRLIHGSEIRRSFDTSTVAGDTGVLMRNCSQNGDVSPRKWPHLHVTWIARHS